MRIIPTLIVISFATLDSSPASAAVMTFTDHAAWATAAGPHSTITFSELPPLTWLSDQYAVLGVHFTDGSDQVYSNSNIFLTDGVGLNGAFDETTLEFKMPITSLAMLFPGYLHVKLYLDGALIFSSFEFGHSGAGNFAGIISSQPFDEAYIYDAGSGLVVDNLYFGPPVPVPGALALVGVAALACHPRRRR